MKNRFFISLLLMLCFISVDAKLTPATDSQRREMSQQINAAASAMTTLDCNFVQVKQLKMLNDKMTSTGVMRYKKSGKLRWEYTSPYKYVFIINGSKVLIDTGKQRNVIDINTNKMFEEIARIMMNSVTGKCLADNKEFAVKYFIDDKGNWVADLTPLKKQMKQMFSLIRLHFDVKQMVVTSVELHEKSGDNTVITLKNIKKNQPVNESNFKIN